MDCAQEIRYESMTPMTYVYGALILIFGLTGVYMVTLRFSSYPLLTVFFFSISTNAAMSVLPHEPVIIMYGKILNLWRLSASATLGTMLAAFLDYRFFGPMLNLPFSARYKKSNGYLKAQKWFCRYPFPALALGGFLPLPYYPFKFLAFSTKYPLAKYMIAVATGRFPRYFLLGLVGWAFKLPNWFVVASFLVIFGALYHRQIYRFLCRLGRALARMLGLRPRDSEIGP